MTEMGFLDELRGVSGSHVLEKKEELVPYLRDASYLVGELPLAAVLPASTGEVASVMRLCNRHCVPVTVRGGGSSLTGSSVPTKGGLVVCMARMNRTLETKIADGYVVCEPGVTIDDLNSHLSRFGFMYPPDPASSMSATVGGTISTNAGGLRATMYGATKEWVLGLEVVLPTGEVIETGGRTLKRTKGYDLTALIVGSEGTLGVVTEAVLKIWPVPEATGRIMAYFRDMAAAGQAISELKSRGITTYAAEFMDRLSLESLKITRGLEYPADASYLLFIDVASTHESLERELGVARGILESLHPVKLTSTTDQAEMQRIYEARKGLYSSSLSLRDRPGQYVTIADVVVPPSELPPALAEMEELIAEAGLKVSLFGHLGDGNVHSNIIVETADARQLRTAEDLVLKMARTALSHSGSVSAEHGIGMEKKRLLLLEFEERKSAPALEVMRVMKRVFDPNGILNSGKIFD